MPESGRTTEPCQTGCMEKHFPGCRFLFHPDYHRRSRNRTGSADPFAVKKRSRTSRLPSHRRWGIAPRPESTVNIHSTFPHVKRSLSMESPSPQPRFAAALLFPLPVSYSFYLASSTALKRDKSGSRFACISLKRCNCRADSCCSPRSWAMFCNTCAPKICH